MHPFQNLSVSCEPMHILVAEDDAPLAEFLHQRLEQEQFSVKMVSNGADAEQLASDQPCDLVILDLNLPGDGGLDVLRGIRSKTFCFCRTRRAHSRGTAEREPPRASDSPDRRSRTRPRQPQRATWRSQY